MTNEEEIEDINSLEEVDKKKKNSLKDITLNVLNFDNMPSITAEQDDTTLNSGDENDLSLRGTLNLLKYDKSNDPEEDSTVIDLLDNLTERFQGISSVSEKNLITIEEIKDDLKEDTLKSSHLNALAELLSTLKKIKVSEEDVEFLLTQGLSSEWQKIVDRSLIVFSLNI